VSELLPVKGIDYLGPLPADIQLVTVFSAGTHPGAKQAEAAKAWTRFLRSPAAAPVIRKKGLDPALEHWLRARCLRSRRSWHRLNRGPRSRSGSSCRSGRAASGDITARTFGQYLEAHARQPVVVENKPGANGIIGTEAAKSAAADGYTLLLTTNTTHAANASLYRKLPYDPLKDFEHAVCSALSPRRRRAAAERHQIDRRSREPGESKTGASILRPLQLGIPDVGELFKARARDRDDRRVVQGDRQRRDGPDGRPDPGDLSSSTCRARATSRRQAGAARRYGRAAAQGLAGVPAIAELYPGLRAQPED